MDEMKGMIENILKNEMLLKAIRTNNINEIETILINQLENNYQLRDYIYRNVEREYRKEDVRNEIEFKNQMYRDECSENDTLPNIEDMIWVTSEQVEQITDRYEEYLQDDDTWNYKLRNAIKDILGEKGE